MKISLRICWWKNCDNPFRIAQVTILYYLEYGNVVDDPNVYVIVGGF